MTTLELLTKAKRLISKPERWCSGPLAFDAAREPVLAHSPNAVCWCTLGALLRVEGSQPPSKTARAYLNRAAREKGFDDGFTSASDYGGHGMAMKVYKRAIELARARYRKAKAK